MLKLYNSLTNIKEDFKVINDNTVNMYSCGPTVYYYPHIGNMRSYLFMDSLRRTLKYNGYTINGVMNITDVGHLTSDEDSGDDKIEKAAKKENKTPYEIAKFYTDIFFKDLKLLNIDIPEHITPATQYINQMIDFIKGLERKGFTYIIDDGVYFDVQKFKNYGQLSKKDLDNTGNARIEENTNKHHAFDFALWKFVSPNHIMKWDSPWGVGCPGWHIECSAMGKSFFGENIDIHTGGIDHKTVHHEDEIAQNDALAGKRVVKTWMHNEFLLVDGGKMSKSLNNIYTISDLINKGFSPLDFKYFNMNTHYSKKINFTFDALKSSSLGFKNLKMLLLEHFNGNNKIEKVKIEEYKQKFLNAMNDDLNYPFALSVIWSMIKEPFSRDIYNTIIEFDSALGLELQSCLQSQNSKKEIEIPTEIVELANERKKSRENKNWQESDRLREKIEQLGYKIKDNKDNSFEIVKI